MSVPSADSDTKPGKNPTLPRSTRRRRRVLWSFVWLLGLAGLLLAVSYTAPVQRWTFARVAARLESGSGIVLRADRTSFDPIRLRTSLDGVSIASRQTPSVPYFTATHVELDAPAAVLRGRLVFNRVRLVNASVDLAKVAHGGPDGGPFRGLGSLQLGDVSVENLSYASGTPGSSRVTIQHVSMKGAGRAPGRLQLESVSPGTLSLEIGDAQLAFGTLTASIVIDGDRLTITRIDARSDTAHVELNGAARFDSGYPIELDYRASIDLPRAADWWAIPDSTLRGQADLSGRISGPLTSPTATARTVVTDFAWRTLSAGRLTADGFITGPGIRIDTFTLAVPEVTARGNGFLSWSDDTPLSSLHATWQAGLLRRLGPLVELDAEDIPLVAATGTANVTWPGFVPDLAALAGTLQTRVASSHPDGDDRGTIDMAGGDARWRMDWRQWLPGDTTAHGQFTVRIDPVVFARSTMSGTLDVTAVDIAPMIKRAAFLDISVPESALTRLEHGRAALSGPVQGTVAMPQWHATLDATDVVMSGLRDITVDGHFVVDPDWFVTEDLTVRAPGSTILVSGTIGVLQPDSDISFNGTVDAAWASAPFAPAEWPLTGTATIKGTWITRTDADDLDVTFESSTATVAGTPVGPLQGRARSGLEEASGHLDLPELGVHLSGTYDLTPAQAHTVSAVVRNGDVSRWLTLAGAVPEQADAARVFVDGTVEASGTFESLETATITARIDALRGNLRGRAVHLSAPAQIVWTRGAVDLGAAVVAVGGVTFAVAPAPDGAAASVVTAAAPLSELLSLLPAESIPAGVVADGGVRVEVRIPHADPRNPTISAVADIHTVTRDGVSLVHDLRAEARADRDRLDVPVLRGTVLGATVDATATAATAWITPQLAGAPTDSSLPTTSTGARLTGTIRAELGPVLEALGVTVPDLSGTGHVTLDLTADASRLDAIRGTIVADTFTLQTRQGTFSQDGPLGVRIEQGSAIVESFVVKGPDSRIQVSGRAALSGETIDVLVEGTASMSIVDALVAPRVGGWADIELHVGGSVSAPALDGSVALRDVSAVSPTARLVLADLNGSATFRPGVVESVDVRGQLNGGTITLTGKFPLGHTQPDGSLVIVARDIFVEYPQGLKNRISADLALEGSAEAPRLTGTTTLLTDPYRESLPRMAQLLAAFGQPAAVAGGGSGDDTSGLLGRLSLDVAIVAAAPLRLDNSLGRIEALPRVRLVGTGLAPALSGPVEIFDGGRIYLQSRTYTLVDSRIDFFPEDGFVPRIQLHGTTKVGEYDVTLRISGPADALELNLSSDPPLPERDLQGLLLTGQTSDGAGGSGETGFAVTALSSDLLGMAGQALGLDSVRIGSESFELVSSDVELTTRLTVSKTLLNRFELIYSENLDNNTTTWILIYRPRRGLEVRASSRDNLTRVAEFRHQLTFGPGGAVAQDAPTAEDQPRAEVPREFVAAVDIIGVPPAAAARLRSILKMKTGRAFDYTEWMRDHDRIRRYYADSGYLTARVVPTRAIVEPGASSRPLVRLGYRVTPGPATSIVVTGMPVNRAFMTRLQQAWALTTFDQFAADDMSRTARGLLFDQGFVIPDVRTVIEDGGENTLVATVTLQPGPKPAKRAVVFDGMTVFSELELVALAVTSGTAESAWRDPGALCLTVANAYADAGYRKAVVRAEPVRVTGDSAELTIVIVEGRPTRVARVRIDGVPEARMTGAQAAAGLEADAILPAGAERAARLRLERYLRNLGFRNATVTAFVGAPGNDGRVDVSLSVSEGRLQVVRAITVEGLQSTRPSLIDRAVTLTPGSPAGLDAEAETERRLYSLGVFNSARVRLVPVPRSVTDTSPDIVPVNAIVSVTEPNKYQFTYGVEFANDYGPIFENFNNAVGVAADVRDRNVFGRGMSMSLGTRYETNLKSVRTLFGMPTIGHVPIRTNVFLAWRDQYTPIDESGELREMSRRAYVEQRWRPKAWIDLSWGYAISDRLFALPATRETPELSFEGILASLNAAVVLDRRDNAMNTSRGWFHSSSLQQGGTWLGSDLGYSRYLGRAFYFVPFGRVVSASGVRFGILTNMSGDAPLEALDLLFRAGGSQTVRGYGQDQLSISLGDGLVFGGTHLLVVNQEFRVKAGKWLQAVVFADAGRSFGDEGFRIRDLAVGLGFGLRIVTPLAPLRIDMGFPVPRRPGDPRYRWHVSVGHIF